MSQRSQVGMAALGVWVAAAGWVVASCSAGPPPAPQPGNAAAASADEPFASPPKVDVSKARAARPRLEKCERPAASPPSSASHAAPAPQPKARVTVTDKEIKISEKVQFATDSAKLEGSSGSLLDEVAGVMKSHPDIQLVEVDGHADKRGAAQKNVALTQARSEAVVAYLTSKGVEPSRLRAVGLGPYCPLDAGENDEAFEKNRRVEFHVIRRAGQATPGAWGGCDEAAKHGVKRPADAPAPRAGGAPASSASAPASGAAAPASASSAPPAPPSPAAKETYTYEETLAKWGCGKNEPLAADVDPAGKPFHRAFPPRDPPPEGLLVSRERAGKGSLGCAEHTATPWEKSMAAYNLSKFALEAREGSAEQVAATRALLRTLMSAASALDKGERASAQDACVVRMQLGLAYARMGLFDRAAAEQAKCTMLEEQRTGKNTSTLLMTWFPQTKAETLFLALQADPARADRAGWNELLRWSAWASKLPCYVSDRLVLSAALDGVGRHDDSVSLMGESLLKCDCSSWHPELLDHLPPELRQP